MGYYLLNYNSYEDVRFFEIGRQKCAPDYDFGPIIRDKYILHYVLSGEGRLEMDGKTYPIHAKQAFVIPAGVLGYYQASHNNPWHYIWIMFHGTKVSEALQKAGISRKYPIYTPKPDGGIWELENCLDQILTEPYAEYACMGRLYEFFHLLGKHASHPLPPQKQADPAMVYVQTVINYIAEKYPEPIRIQDIADFCGLDRAYLSSLFKQATGRSPKHHLIHVRLSRAKQLLKETDLPIQHISYSIGYSDPLAFSKFFKQETGMSPTEFRKKYGK